MKPSRNDARSQYMARNCIISQVIRGYRGGAIRGYEPLADYLLFSGLFQYNMLYHLVRWRVECANFCGYLLGFCGGISGCNQNIEDIGAYNNDRRKRKRDR